MRDYICGVFESLNWVLELLRSNLPRKIIIREVESALDGVRRGVAMDFRYRLRELTST